MADGDAAFAPGDLVRARGREWIVLPQAAPEILRLRPLTGSEADIQTLAPKLELEPIISARFAAPDIARTGPSEAALLLKDALRLSLRRGAGPFRSLGGIGFAPRAYQLVPLMMALKLDVVRLLIADDVGIGKTIEAGLILRELYDRGEIETAAVLCPPHLVEQWVLELRSKFALSATAVTSASAARLERELPPGANLFEAHPFTVVSLDFIKAPQRRHEFLTHAPSFIVVDEAHTCVSGGQERHRRFDLLRGLAEDASRALVMLTATPHSGDEQAFWNLLSLLHPDFARLAEAGAEERDRLRRRLADHYVQRRRIDIDAWKGQEGAFPAHKSGETGYRLAGVHEGFLFEVLDYCRAVVERREGDARRQRLAFWGTLALMRCAGSSPAAALSALRTRAPLDAPEEEAEAIAGAVLDSDFDDRAEDDAEPASDIGDPALARLIDIAAELAADPAHDPKLQALGKDIDALLAEGFRPVVFCRYIATAQTVADALRRRFRTHEIDCVTGELTPEERRERVDALVEHERRILVATDCLSEGINLQEGFDAVVHYDLSWNPTRHQQREGRVDRFGQPSPEVRSILIYGANNPVDGAVLQVILRKAETIRRETGVPMPMPGDERSLTEALMRAVLLRRGQDRQRSFFDAGLLDEAATIDRAWEDAAQKEKQSRTRFAQRALAPEAVVPEWEASRAALGGETETRRFVTRALRRLGAPLEPRGTHFVAPLAAVDSRVRERLAAEGLIGDLRLSFDPKPGRAAFIHRAHPLTAILAETLFERALAGGPVDPANLERCGAWTSAEVGTMTTIALVRLRHRLTSRWRGAERTLLVEEPGALAWRGAISGPAALTGKEALALLDAAPGSNLTPAVIARQLEGARTRIQTADAELAAFAAARAAELAVDHDRLRKAADAGGTTEVTAVTPLDIIGLYVLLPDEA